MIKRILRHAEFIHLFTLVTIIILGTAELVTNGFTYVFMLYVPLALWMGLAFIQARYIKIVRNNMKRQLDTIQRIKSSADQLIHTMQHSQPIPRQPIHHDKEKEKVYH